MNIGSKGTWKENAQCNGNSDYMVVYRIGRTTWMIIFGGSIGVSMFTETTIVGGPRRGMQAGLNPSHNLGARYLEKVQPAARRLNCL